MWEFLCGMAVGALLTDSSRHHHGKDALPEEKLYESAQNRTLIEIVRAADKIEKTNPTPELLRLQLQPLKSMFDAIDFNGIHSPEGKTVYRQVKDYFSENDL